MKKTLLALIPTLLMISACDGSSFKVDFLNGISHEPGMENQSTPYSYASVAYSYTVNSSYDVSALNKVTFTFKNINVSDSDVVNVETIKSYIDCPNPNFTYTIGENVKHFGTKNDGFAFLGNDYNDEYGQITFNVSEQIKNVTVKVKQYSYLKTAFNENKLIVDEDVAIGCNDIGFIKIDKPIFNEDQNEIINDTTCAFAFSEPTNTITIKAGRKRAILEEINFYY
ncbi:MAG: hypothetical protein J6N95_05110 [Bacilli bacterium]|nr:hypothetical protein [Bacilli bacterium]